MASVGRTTATKLQMIHFWLLFLESRGAHTRVYRRVHKKSAARATTVRILRQSRQIGAPPKSLANRSEVLYGVRYLWNCWRSRHVWPCVFQHEVASRFKKTYQSSEAQEAPVQAAPSSPPKVQPSTQVFLNRKVEQVCDVSHNILFVCVFVHVSSLWPSSMNCGASQFDGAA
jgi:hypothetical protein